MSGKNPKTNRDSEGKPVKRGKRRHSDDVEYFEEKFDLKSKLRIGGQEK